MIEHSASNHSKRVVVILCVFTLGLHSNILKIHYCAYNCKLSTSRISVCISKDSDKGMTRINNRYNWKTTATESLIYQAGYSSWSETYILEAIVMEHRTLSLPMHTFLNVSSPDRLVATLKSLPCIGKRH